MNSEKNLTRLLGAAFLIVFIASMLSGSLLDSAVGSGGISDILINVANNLTLMRISILVELLTSVGIVVLASLLYILLHKQGTIMARVALGWWLAEAIILAVSKIGAYALIPLSQEFVAAGTPAASYFQTLGDFFYYGLDRQGWALHMLFFSLGGVLWYSLFYRSGYIPRVLSGWGVVAVSLVALNVMVGLFDRSIGLQMIMLVPYLVFEALIGPWLMLKGIRHDAEISSRSVAMENL